MRGLLYGVRPERWTPPDADNHLLVGLSRVPMRMDELDLPHPVRDGWVMAKTRLTGICGSDAKQVFMDFGDDYTDSALNGLFTFPTVLGHEVVAEVAEVGPGVDTLEVGQRVVLNPWLSCAPRGVTPLCGACQDGDYSLCWHFTRGPLAAGIHTGTSKDAPGGFAEYLPAHHSMLIPVPDSIPDEVAVLADPFAVSLHSVTRHPPPLGGKVLIYGGGALGITATAIVRALHPDVEVMVVARFPAQAALARRLGATVVSPWPVQELLEEAAAWSGGVLQRVEGSLPMAHPGGIDVVYDTVGTGETAEIGVRLLKARGTMVKSGVHAPERWEWSPLYFKEISWVGSNAFGVEEIDGVRRHGIAHYLHLVADGRINLAGMLTHTFTLDQWREAFTALATQEHSGAIKAAFDFRST
ncbi:MAG TPA: alcohol dehydrogenase catalytic domain-containing protein [Acidimicrobiales bacterium]|jgi:threonine dehydrogenase-like Zn-dependent dehydrogenase|nr:alcohol dehydrogenase catalytic domain-containing protein [Acidimicrobiales bacterium]